MSYNRRRYETLRRLGVEQVPTLRHPRAHIESQRRHYDIDLPVRTMPVCLIFACNTSTKLTEHAGSRPTMPQLRISRTDSLGHPGQEVSAVWDTSQLKTTTTSPPRDGKSEETRHRTYDDDGIDTSAGLTSTHYSRERAMDGWDAGCGHIRDCLGTNQVWEDGIDPTCIASGKCSSRDG